MTYESPIVTYARKHDLKLSRESYIAANWPDGAPEPWTVELEMDLPVQFQWDGRGMVPFRVAGNSLAAWAAYLARDDKSRIDNAIRSGLIGGLNNVAIARKVVGSAGVRGIDGVTEITRQRVAHLGRAANKRRILRKKGNKS